MWRQRLQTVRPYSVRHVLQVTRALFWEADTTTTRLILALASLLFGIGLLLPSTDMSGRVGFALMRALASEAQWAAMFLLNFVLLSWRFLDPRPRVWAALAVNAYGLLIWTVSTVAINYGFASFAPGTSAEIVLCLFAAWNLFRTGLRAEILQP